MSDPSQWQLATDSKGRRYYYNKATRETRWDPPDTANAIPRTQQPGPQGSGYTPPSNIDPNYVAEGISRLNIQPSTQTAGTLGLTERLLEPGYRQQSRPKDFFQVGRVFLTLWSAPTTQSVDSNPSEITQCILGENVFSKIRRFVVIREGHNYCLAVPVSTYDYRGVGKPGTVKSDHAIIYTGSEVPQPLESELSTAREDGMLPLPIRVNPDVKGEKLHRVSRIDFARHHTVEHNLKVRSFGMVVNLRHLLLQYNQVCKNHEPSAYTETASTSAHSASQTRGPTQDNLRQLSNQQQSSYTHTSSGRLPSVPDEEEGQQEEGDEIIALDPEMSRRIAEYLIRNGYTRTQAATEATAAVQVGAQYNQIIETGRSADEAIEILADRLSRMANGSIEAARERIKQRIAYCKSAAKRH